MTWAPAVRGLFLAAMAVFLVTIGIGIVNGLDLYEFEHDALLIGAPVMGVSLIVGLAILASRLRSGDLAEA